ncbi:GxxExxY protein [Elizabethkingia anophelis]|uniref:GxxExxY protein n=1 Tax=Elizabethkingia anophelis TaxID=1117645 RepID=UPI000CE95760|nr:GxxExxY protein [Elizabethkingia anophelis]AVF47315.1 GxxExxY protein [Elizabethkingia anophelis]AVF51307.1 GxxExxY protein [Elizabethkingia anophelis]MBG0504825.1 GxxExxY protein [Elizabethkingia anophelis]MCT4072831.1 GxxExxY protein [Elizabethkingia anophelis]MDV3900083.1 GxxExxY protein [Elizabethkingia anophelis]
MTKNEISNIVFDAGMRIHRKLGVDLYENVYEECLAYELNGRGLLVEKQRDVKIEYEELIIDKAFRIDLLIENKLIIEVKAVSEINDYHSFQLYNYLILTGLKLGMLLNFHSPLFKNGVKRVVNKL